MRPLTPSELRLSEEHPGWSFLLQERDADILEALERRAEQSGPLDWRGVVLTGGFPRVMAAPLIERTRLLNDYIEVFASRDIREIIGIESSERFESFLRLVATHTGQILNVAGMAADLGA